MTTPAILVVDDQESHRDLTCSVLANAGYRARAVPRAASALDDLRRDTYGLVLCDQIMPEMSGLELLRRIREQWPDLPVVIVTAHGSVDTAVDAMKAGAADFIQKPFSPDALMLVVRRVLERQNLVEEVRLLRERVGDLYGFERIVGKNPQLIQIFEKIRSLADLDTTVLITGETGTGKELVAHAIHQHSNRRTQRFVRINCGAITETLLESELFGHERGAFSGAIQARRGKFEYADGGTLLLDEIGDVSPAMQLKLLRVLQEKEIQRVGSNDTIKVDVRILATTNRDLEAAINDGSFRSDLYYRLNVVRIHIPPLRDRMSDVPMLAEHFQREFSGKTGRKLRGLSREVLHDLLAYHWPGNVRELGNVIERAAIMATGEQITHVELPHPAPSSAIQAIAPAFNLGMPFKEGRHRVIADFERAYLTACLTRYQGNIALSAQHCGVDNKTFYRKMQEYDLDKRLFKQAAALDTEA